MGHGNFEARGAARFQNKQQSTWRNGIQWHIGQRVSTTTWLRRACPKTGLTVSDLEKTRIFGTITGFEANHKNRASVKWDEQPEGVETPFHFLQDWGTFSRVTEA